MPGQQHDKKIFQEHKKCLGQSFPRCARWCFCACFLRHAVAAHTIPTCPVEAVKPSPTGSKGCHGVRVALDGCWLWPADAAALCVLHPLRLCAGNLVNAMEVAEDVAWQQQFNAPWQQVWDAVKFCRRTSSPLAASCSWKILLCFSLASTWFLGKLGSKERKPQKHKTVGQTSVEVFFRAFLRRPTTYWFPRQEGVGR